MIMDVLKVIVVIVAVAAGAGWLYFGYLREKVIFCKMKNEEQQVLTAEQVQKLDRAEGLWRKLAKYCGWVCWVLVVLLIYWRDLAETKLTEVFNWASLAAVAGLIVAFFGVPWVFKKMEGKYPDFSKKYRLLLRFLEYMGTGLGLAGSVLAYNFLSGASMTSEKVAATVVAGLMFGSAIYALYNFVGTVACFRKAAKSTEKKEITRKGIWHLVLGVLFMGLVIGEKMICTYLIGI